MYVFVSDVHLNEPQSKRYGAFLRLLDDIKNTDELTDFFMVGDIFEMWLDDRGFFVNKHKDVIDKIRDIAKTKNVHYFEGNHDFQLGSLWPDIGVKVYPDEHEFNIRGRKVLVAHGDLLNKDDKNYLRLRWLLRTPLFKIIIRFLPTFLLVKLGALLSTTEQKEAPTTEQKEEFLKSWKKWTSDLYLEKEYDVFICGHYHVNADVTFKETGARAVNLGTWLDGDFSVFEL